MKIITMPGVGFNTNVSGYERFAKYIGDNLNCESEVFCWKHTWPLPDITLPFENIRTWVYEVLLDFQQVILYAFDMEIPEADYYIGHSAGSILALAQKEKSCVIMGSPSILIESIHKSVKFESDFNAKLWKTIESKRNILNVINKYDQLAYYLDLPNVENYVFQGSWNKFNTYNPINAHNGYWENKEVMDVIVKNIKKWEEQKNI